jgi:hypothetical protein
MFLGYGSVCCSQLRVNHLARDQSMTSLFKVVPNKLIAFQSLGIQKSTVLSL